MFSDVDTSRTPASSKARFISTSSARLRASRAFHARSLLATIQVRFIGEVPASIWQFTGASPFARPQAANQYNRTHLDAQQRATLTQRDVHSGLFGGFGWEW